jgi:UDP-N-acetylmuramate dehydrogenase
MPEPKDIFTQIIPGGVYTDEPMKQHTTFRIGGPADYFLVPDTVQEMKQLLSACRDLSIPYFIMGNGSNLLVSDSGYRGAVIQVARNMSRIEVSGNTVRAEAGALLSAIASRALEASLAGFEFAGGIPGTLGGAVFMNAGAYGGEMKDVISEITVLDASGNESTLPASELAFGYRTSIVRDRGFLVLSAEISLSAGDAEEIRRKSDDLRMRRQNRQPLEMPSAGSTFKRPEGYFAGKLIMDAGLRGARVGGAQVSEKHCGFIVNTGNATASDVRSLISLVQETVFEKEHVRLEPEVRTLGDF